MTAHSPSGPDISITGVWERPAAHHLGDTNTLMVTITTSMPDPRHRERLPIDLALVLDRSGSMAGEKLALVKQAILEAVEHLGPEDTFSVVMFESAVQELVMPTPGTADSRQRLAAALREVQAGGGTNLHGGWLTGCEHLGTLMRWEGIPHVHRTVVLTDGLANVGITDPHALTVQADALRQRGITTSTMGVGFGFNEVLLSSMAEAGGGTFAYISRPHELMEFFHREVCGLLDVALPQPRLTLTLPPGMHATLVNPFPVRQDGMDLVIDLRDLTAMDTLTLVLDATLAPGEPGMLPAPRAKIELPHSPGTHGRLLTSFDPLPLVSMGEAEGVSADRDVQVQAARLRADRHHRDAMRLDREGRVDEAREILGKAAMMLAAAPLTEDIVAEQDETLYLFESVGRLGENARKARVYRAMRRSRGHASP